MSVNNDIIRQVFSLYCHIIKIMAYDSVNTPEEGERFILLLVRVYKIVTSNGYRIRRGCENGVPYHELTSEDGRIVARIVLV